MFVFAGLHKFNMAIHTDWFQVINRMYISSFTNLQHHIHIYMNCSVICLRLISPSYLTSINNATMPHSSFRYAITPILYHTGASPLIVMRQAQPNMNTRYIITYVLIL